MAKKLRVAILGAGRRSDYLYGPLVKGMSDDVELVAVWARRAAPARALGKSLGVPAYTDVEKLKRETGADIGIVSVSQAGNGEVGLMAVEAGLHLLIETPIAQKLSDADRMIAAAKRNRVKIEVAEQFHRRPLEAIKLKLIESGIFGRVHSSFNDFAGHGYHGVSVMRSYLGFDARPLTVSGAVHQYPLLPHTQRHGRKGEMKAETQEHGLIEFEGGRLGVYHWTSVGYDSPLRWWRSSRFLAERGMGITVGVHIDVEERMSTLAPGGEQPLFITLERRLERVDGGALLAMVAHTGDPKQPLVRWDNPFRPAVQGHGMQWHDDEIGVAGCLMSLVNAIRGKTEPTYGALQGRLDQELILGIRLSAKMGQPVSFPLDPETVA
jgi:predicted dehydrogenase